MKNNIKIFGMGTVILCILMISVPTYIAEQTMSCGEGYHWDEEAQDCVPDEDGGGETEPEPIEKDKPPKQPFRPVIEVGPFEADGEDFIKWITYPHPWSRGILWDWYM